MYIEAVSYTSDKSITYGIEYKTHVKGQTHWSTKQAFHNDDNSNYLCSSSTLPGYQSFKREVLNADYLNFPRNLANFFEQQEQ